MNENIDLTKILKDCPEGSELYSTVLGEVKFVKCIKLNVIIVKKEGEYYYFTPKGLFILQGMTYYRGECTLFPSKDQRDWAKFTAPWYKNERFDPKTLKPFDRVLVRDSCAYSWRCTLYSHTKENENTFKYVAGASTYEYCIPYNDDTKHLVGTKDEAPEFYRYWEDSYEYEKKE